MGGREGKGEKGRKRRGGREEGRMRPILCPDLGAIEAPGVVIVM